MQPKPAVRAIICDPENRVLFLKRANTDYLPDYWCLPGGKIDFGDSAGMAVCQEINEETGLFCTGYHFLFYRDNLPTETLTTHFVTLFFECTVAGDIVLNEESSEFAWIALEDLEKYPIAFQNDEAVRKYWSEQKTSHTENHEE